MNWYKIAMALDPNAWEYEENPARLTEDKDYVVVPAGGRKYKVPQKPQNLENKYKGVHFTDAKELAAIYACYKSSLQDPPVLIELDPVDFQKEPDIDAALDQRLTFYLEEKKKEWNAILESSATNEEKFDAIIEDLDGDNMDWGNSDDISDVGDVVIEGNQSTPPILLETYFRKFTPEQALQQVQEILNGNIPSQLMIEAINQYRIMQPVGGQRVKAIYQIPLMDFSIEVNESSYLYDGMEDEELEEKGYKKVGDDVYTEEGKLVPRYEDLGYSDWISMKPLYVNNQMSFPQFSSEESTWHGTSLSRAKRAFPDLLAGVHLPQQAEETVEAQKSSMVKIGVAHKIMYHNTDKGNLFLIQRNGLKINQEWGKTTGAQNEVEAIYGIRPIFLSATPDRFKGKNDVTLVINVEGLDLVADIPSVYDKGAYYSDDMEGMWFEEEATPFEIMDFVDGDGMIYFKDMLTPDSPLAEKCIEWTGTAACENSIEPNRISVMQ